MCFDGVSCSSSHSDVYMKWQKLSEENGSQVFNPSVLSSHATGSSVQDELVITDTELHRIHTLGRKLIHTNEPCQVRHRKPYGKFKHFETEMIDKC